jgi:hypothetical protein
MAKKFRFSILGDVTNATNVAGVAYSYDVKGKTIKQGNVASDGVFTISFKNSNKALNGSIEFEDLNGANTANFTNGGLEYSLASGESSRFKANAKKSPQTFTYAFSLSNPVSPIPPPNPQANRLTLTTFEDIYSDVIGGQVIGGTFTPNNERFTAGQDIVTSTAGTLGQQDSLTDNTAGDNDEIRTTTNANNNLQNSVAATTRIAGIENLYATGSNDSSNAVDLSKFTGLNTIKVDGTFTNQLTLNQYLTSGARTFDFSGMTSGGVNISNANSGINTGDALTMIGSRVDDTLEANIGAATLKGGLGGDTIIGSTVSSVYAEGGFGFDTVRLFANNARDTVSLRNITESSNGDNVINFTGFGANNTNYDLVEFDAATFTNYTAGTNVIQVNANQAATAAAAQAGKNMFVVDTIANIQNLNASAQGTSWLAYATDISKVVYANNGDFTGFNYEVIATLNGVAADFNAATQASIVA